MIFFLFKKTLFKKTAKNGQGKLSEIIRYCMQISLNL